MVRSLFCCFLILLVSCASTNFSLTGESRPSISTSSVKKYDKMPDNAIEIGIVKSSLASYYGGAELKREFKKQAAKVGANGYTIIKIERSISGFGTSGSYYTGEATVFFVP